MAEIAKSGTPSLSTMHPCPAHRPCNSVAGAAIAAGDALYKNADGKLYPTNGTAANDAALYVGFAAVAASINEAVTPVHGVYLHYGAGLVPGKRYYVSAAVPGGLSDTATIGGTVPVAYAYDATQIYAFDPGR